MRNSCVIYDSWKEMIVSLPDEMAGELIKMILTYAIDGERYPTENPALVAMFNMISKKLDEDEAKYNAQVERAKKNSERKRNEINTKSYRSRTEVVPKSEQDQVEVKGDTVTVSDSESVTVSDSVKDKKHIYGEYRHVRLTDAERDRLFNDYGEAETLKAIRFLDEYKERKGYKSKNDNLTLRNWVFDAVKEQDNKRIVVQPQEKSLAEKWGLKNDA